MYDYFAFCTSNRSIKKRFPVWGMDFFQVAMQNWVPRRDIYWTLGWMDSEKIAATCNTEYSRFLKYAHWSCQLGVPRPRFGALLLLLPTFTFLSASNWSSGCVVALGNWSSGCVVALGNWSSGCVVALGNWSSGSVVALGNWSSGCVVALGNWSSGCVAASACNKHALSNFGSNLEYWPTFLCMHESTNQSSKLFVRCRQLFMQII